MENRFIRLKEVVNRVGISKSNIYRLIPEGKFPRPIQLGPNSVAWLESEVSGWVNEKIERGRAA
jgi:prophage regulatory protein